MQGTPTGLTTTPSATFTDQPGSGPLVGPAVPSGQDSTVGGGDSDTTNQQQPATMPPDLLDSVIWGATAAAAIGTATAYVLEQEKKRKEEEARARAEAERANAEARAIEKGYDSYLEMVEEEAKAAFDANWNAMLAATQTTTTLQSETSGVRHMKERDKPVQSPPPPSKSKEINPRLIKEAQGTGQLQLTPTLATLTPTLTSTPTPTIIPYQSYKTIGPLTSFEATVGGPVAHNADILLSNADDYYFWGTNDKYENNSYPPLAGISIKLPMPILTSDMHLPWGSISDVYEYTGGKTPFVCGDIPDWAYYMAGYNLQLLLPDVSELYPNRWPRSSYGYLTMLYQANNQHIWNVMENPDKIFVADDVPELGDVVITQFDNEPGSILGASHVVVVFKINGYSPDKIFIIEGNPDEGTIVLHSLAELINRLPELHYLI